MQTITPFLWFDNNLEEAMNFYISVFKDAKIESINRMGPDGPVFSATFVLNGQKFMAFNAGPKYKFTEAVSFFVDCKTQDEVDYLWEKLSDGGELQRCGWLKDKFGLSWQIIPSTLGKLLYDKDPAKSGRVMEAMMKMVKIESKVLEEAYAG